jgi:hypothetical protein
VKQERICKKPTDPDTNERVAFKTKYFQLFSDLHFNSSTVDVAVT